MTRKQLRKFRKRRAREKRIRRQRNMRRQCARRDAWKSQITRVPRPNILKWWLNR